MKKNNFIEDINQNDIKALFQSKYHGASSINGFYYQIMYSVLLSLELFKNQSAIITLEGIEDIDYNKTDSKYIQVKFRKDKVSWTDFMGILKTFVKTYEIDKEKAFQIVTNNSFTPSIEEFKTSLQKKKKTKIKIMKEGECNLTSYEIDKLFDLISYEILSISKIEEKVNNGIIYKYNCSVETANVIRKVLITNFTAIATKRGNITYQKISILCNKVLEAISTQEYSAYGRGLIDKVNWDSPTNESFFYSGKAVQPGHIKLNFDVKRKKWLDIIHESFSNNNATFLKAPSGQGKTTLMYRYAREYGIEETTFIVKKMKDDTDVVTIFRFLEAINEIGLPILVLIDNVNADTSYWASLISKCQYPNIIFLLTIREENWYEEAHYSEIGFNIVSPYLDGKEAKDIFEILKKKNLIHTELVSYQKAYELLKDPKLLIEYLYLCTQGMMLKDRLNDQIKKINKTDYALTKKKIIRIVSLAHVLDIEIKIDMINDMIPDNEDVEVVIESIKDEFLSIKNGMVSGFHQIRSEHLVSILHYKYLTIHGTAKELFKYIQKKRLYAFAYNLLTKFPVGLEQFVDYFKKEFESLSLLQFNNIIKAFYNAGIKNFVDHNETIINKGYDLTGFGALMIISYELGVKEELFGFESIVNEIDTGYYPVFRKLIEEFVKVDSGIDFVRYLLNNVAPVITNNDYLELGIFLSWCSFVNYKIDNNELDTKMILFAIDFDKLSFKQISHYTLGLYRYNADLYFKFIEINNTSLRDYLKFELNCFNIEFSEKEIIIKFIPVLSEYPYALNQAYSRLQNIYMIYPYYDHYKSLPEEININGLKPTVSDNYKDMIPKYLLPEFEGIRQSELYRQMLLLKTPTTHYDIQKYWFDFRSDSIRIVSFLVDFYAEQYTKQTHKMQRNGLKKIDSLWLKLHEYYSKIPCISSKTATLLHIEFDVEQLVGSEILSNWAHSLGNFYTQLKAFLIEKDNLRLCLHNLKDVISYLNDFHSFFEHYFTYVDDYFNQLKLNKIEIEIYQKIYDLLELRFIWKKEELIKNPISFVRNLRLEKLQFKIDIIKNYLPVNAKAIEQIYEEKHLSYITIMLECTRTESNFEDVFSLLHFLKDIKTEVVTYYWIVPLYNGNRFNEFGYCISYSTIRKLGNEINDVAWETFMPRKIPKSITTLIPEYKIVESTVYNNKANSEAIKVANNLVNELDKFVAILPDKMKFEKMLKEKYINQIECMREEIYSDNN